jgi:S-adenosylmethionine:tRNA ribosyltransferase-isomerase
MKEKGVEETFVTLHVGPGNLSSLRTERVEDHEMHEEEFEGLSRNSISCESCTQRGEGQFSQWERRVSVLWSPHSQMEK